MTRPPRTLDQLPTEILALILQHVKGSADLRSCCLVSRRFNDVSERELYKAVNIDFRAGARRFALAARRQPGRRTYVRSARIVSSKPPVEFAGLNYWTSMMLCPTLVGCHNLEELNLASHYCDRDDLSNLDRAVSDDVQYYKLDLFDMLRRASLHTPPNERGLPKLTTLRLHFKQMDTSIEPRWDVGPDLMHVFLSPTLREIALYRCRFDVGPAALERLRYADFERSTPLETLRLRSCWASIHVLQQIFSLPRGLKTFLLDDNYEVDPAAPGPFSNLDDWTELLSQQKDSLEEIAFVVGFEALDRFSGFLDFRGMGKVRLLAGTVLESENDNVKWLPHVKTMTLYEYHHMIWDTQAEWIKWIEDVDLQDEYDDSEGELDFYHHHHSIIDLDDIDDMGIEDYDEDGNWIFEIWPSPRDR